MARQVEAWLAAKTVQVTTALAERQQLGPVEERLRVQLTPKLPEMERQRLMCTPYGDLLDAVILLGGEPLTRKRADRLAIIDPGSRALANTLRRELPSFAVIDDGHDVHQVRSVAKPGSRCVTSALLDLVRFLPGPCPHGLLLALPRYSQVLLHPVQPDSLQGAAGAMAEHVRGTYLEADDPCDDRLYWWADDSLHVIGFSRLTGRPKLPQPLRRLIS